jgi:hypothetical protein
MSSHFENTETSDSSPWHIVTAAFLCHLASREKLMKPTLAALAILLSVPLARADTKSVLDVRAMNYTRSNTNGGTSGIGLGAGSRKAKNAPTTGTSSPQDHLTR